jgi:hypothetical protein
MANIRKNINLASISRQLIHKKENFHSEIQIHTPRTYY